MASNGAPADIQSPTKADSSSSSALGRRAFPPLALLALAPVAALGQTASGIVAGMVTDSTGAASPGAQISVADAPTGVGAKAGTRINGVFRRPNVTPGDYNIVAEAEGFKWAAVNGASEIPQPIESEIGAITEVVDVSAEQLQIQALPLPNRDICNLVNLVPGPSAPNRTAISRSEGAHPGGRFLRTSDGRRTTGPR